MILDSGTKKFVFEKFVHLTSRRSSEFLQIYEVALNFPQLFAYFLRFFFSQLLDQRHDSGEKSKIRQSQHPNKSTNHIKTRNNQTFQLSKFCIIK